MDLYWEYNEGFADVDFASPELPGSPLRMITLARLVIKGIEFSLSGVIYENKDWNITAGMNINFNKGKGR